MSTAITGPTQTPVAEYVRMSTDHQQYSVVGQQLALAEYASANGMEIVHSYADEGCSGLTLERRPALQALLQDAQDPACPFDAVLVYDVSRWGRFQDADESAYYEHMLRRAGVRVIYCAEPFENDGSPLSTIVKSVKRAMAGEYSRELSTKVAAGQRRMAERGFRQGSHAGYGLRRVAVSENGLRRVTLERGEHKVAHSDRIVLEPGPAEEVATVHRIFVLYVHARFGPKRIAKQLELENAATGALSYWHGGAINKILKNEKYIGTNVFGKQTCHLRGKRVSNPSETWVRVERAFKPIIGRELFEAAQALRKRIAISHSDEELLEGLRRIRCRSGTVTGKKIQADPELPSIAFYRKKFGRLSEAYERAGVG